MKNSKNEEVALPNESQTGVMNSRIAQFYVFQGEKYLGWDCFDKKRVTIGKSPEADLVLSDDTLSDIQALFTISADGILVSDYGNTGAFSVNDKVVSNCILKPLDILKIGTYTIKVKLKKINEESASVAPVPEKPVKQLKEKVTATAPESKPDSQTKFPSLTYNTTAATDKKADKSKLEKTLKLKVPLKNRKKPEETELSLETTLELKPESKNRKSHQPAESVKEIVQRTVTQVLVNEVDAEKSDPVSESNSPAVKINETYENTFPKSFFAPVYDLEDNEEDDDDFPANFSLKEKLTGSERNIGRTKTSNKQFEIIKLRGDNVISITHLSGKESHCLINQKNTFCRVENYETDKPCLFFTEPLLNKINVAGDKKLETIKAKSLKSLTKRENTYKSFLNHAGETKISDGFYDYVLRTTYVAEKRVEEKPVNDIPLRTRVIQSAAFRHTSKALIFHLVVLIVLSLTVEIPDIEEFKNPETHFVVIDTKNIHKPVKPKPKPKPAVKQKAVNVVKKKIEKQGTQVAALRKKPGKKVDKPKAGGGHKGNLVNRNVNQVGLLGALGLKTGIKVKSNEALAAVTNIDAVTSTHSREAKIKIGGIVGSLGDANIAIPTGGVFNSKGSTDVLRSAGIGGKGSIAALEAGNTGKRAVAGTVSAPLTKKVRFKGGGISREAVAKVINQHLDEITYCYETSLISDPSLMGKVVFEWKILPSGKVGEVKIKSSTLRSSDIHSCIKSAIRSWKFPEPKGGAAIISYPFVFDVSGF